MHPSVSARRSSFNTTPATTGTPDAFVVTFSYATTADSATVFGRHPHQGTIDSARCFARRGADIASQTLGFTVTATVFNSADLPVYASTATWGGK